MVNISHVNGYLRQVALHTPTLWTSIPPLNTIGRDVFRTLLHRSRPHKFRVAYIEDGSIDAQMWGLLFNNRSRMEYLHGEVSKHSNGSNTLMLLTLDAPSLRQCCISFQDRYVHVPFEQTSPLFQHNAPDLVSLTFRNATLSTPQYENFANLSHFMLLRDGLPARGLVVNGGNSLYGLQFCMIQSLVLENCHLSRSAFNSSDELIFEHLSHLRITATHQLCTLLAARLVYPDDCTCLITYIFPNDASLLYAEASGGAILAFILPDEKFTAVSVDLENPDEHGVVLVSAERALDFRFRFGQSHHPISSRTRRLLAAAVNLLTLSFVLPHPLTPTVILSCQVWDSVSIALNEHVDQTVHISVTFSDDPLCIEPSYIRPLVSKLPSAHCLTVEPISAFDNPLFLNWAAQTIPSLNCFAFTLTDYPDRKTLLAMLHLLESRQFRNFTHAPMALSVRFSNAFIDQLGFSAQQSIQSIFSDIEGVIPASTIVKWNHDI